MLSQRMKPFELPSEDPFLLVLDRVWMLGELVVVEEEFRWSGKGS